MRWLVIFLCFFNFVNAKQDEEKIKKYFFNPEVTSLSISDWYNPSVEDYKLIQNFLREKASRLCSTPLSSRPFPTAYLNEDFHGWIMYRMSRSGGLVKWDETDNVPVRKIIYFNNDPDNKKKCIICYVNYPRSATDKDRDYVRSLNFLIHALEKTHFDGHFIYYIGGWPGVDKGRLKFIDCPYGFKPFLFEEARDLGYENILWLDACVIPVKNVNPVFDFIKKKGICFFTSHSRPSWRQFDMGYASLMPSMAMSRDKPYEEVSARVIGLNMTDPKGVDLLNKWLVAAEKKIPFLVSDEPVLMYLINYLKLNYGAIPNKFFATMYLKNFSYWNGRKEIILYHDYGFLDPTLPLPDDSFFNR